MKNLALVMLSVALVACSGGGGGDGTTPAPQAPQNQAIGGIWQGVDSTGDDIVGLVAEDGRFHFIDSSGQGYGIASVSNGNQVNANYTYVADLGTTFSDGSTSAACTLSGTVAQRQSLTVTSNCTSTAGSAYQVTVAMTYNALYDRDASLTTIAGLYDDYGDVLDISSTGVLFEQDATDGCILNGQVSVISPSYNAYQVQFTVSNCNPNLAVLNGSSWSGLATLDNTVSPQELIFGVVGNVASATFALVGIAPRI